MALLSKYDGPPYCRTEMNAGRVACCPLVVAVSMPTGQTDGQTDGQQSVTLCFALDAASVISQCLRKRVQQLKKM